LFDIDGTLIDAGKAGTCSINKAFHELFLIENAFENITLAGKTDVQIIKEALAFYELTPKYYKNYKSLIQLLSPSISMIMMHNFCAGEKIIHHRVTEITEILFVVPTGRVLIIKH
jgi:hypothetical protein